MASLNDTVFGILKADTQVNPDALERLVDMASRDLVLNASLAQAQTNGGVKFRLAQQRIAASLRLGALLLSGMALSGCALHDRNGETMAQHATKFKESDLGSLTQSMPSPLGYHYPPGDLWLRLLEVIKTNPEKMTHQKLGGIFGIEFDEKKIFWQEENELKKYFFVTKQGIKNNIVFPFGQISFSQRGPYKSTGRLMLFDMDIFDVTPDLQALLEQSEKYCVKPNVLQIEALGFYYDKISSSMPPPTDRNGLQAYRPYREEIFVDSLSNRLEANKIIFMRVLQNGCLVGVRYDVLY